MEMRNRCRVCAGLKACGSTLPLSSMIDWRICGQIFSARGFGSTPRDALTNNWSPNALRSRFSALLAADCVSPSLSAARVTWRSTITTLNTVSRFRSMRLAPPAHQEMAGRLSLFAMQIPRRSRSGDMRKK